MGEDLRWAARALRQRARCHMDWRLNHAERWWYTAKALICMMLRRDERAIPPDPFLHQIEVAHGGYMRTYHPEFGEGAGWDYLAVGGGVRRGWWYTVSGTGYP